MKLFDATLSTLERALDVRMTRQAVLAGNLANLDTPGFVPLDVDFSAAMAAAVTPAPPPAEPMREPAPAVHLASFHPLDAGPPILSAAAGPVHRAADLPLDAGAQAAPAPERFVVKDVGTAPGLDRNAVDLDRTMAAIAENAIQYGASARAASKKLTILRYVASDGAA